MGIYDIDDYIVTELDKKYRPKRGYYENREVMRAMNYTDRSINPVEESVYNRMVHRAGEIYAEDKNCYAKEPY